MQKTHYEKSGKVWVPNNLMRKREKVALYELPPGVDVSLDRSIAIHKRIQDDTLLRERLIVAQKMTGKKIMHLDMMSREMNAETEKKLLNQTEQAEGKKADYEKDL